MLTRPRRQPGEEGATAVIIAAAMVLLMGFAAIAVDNGVVLDERRQDQNAADAAALSAGVAARVAPTQTGCASSGSIERTAACNGAVVAMDTVAKNLDVPFLESDFADTSRCGNAAFPSEYHTGGSNDGVVPKTSTADIVCIRFNENLSRVRIVLPVVDVDTTFGRILGRDSVPVSAVSEAELTLGGPGNILPFAVGPTGAAQSHSCVFEPGSGLNDGPCDGPADGNFGYLMSYLYGNSELGTPIACGSAGGLNDSTRIAASLAKGSDHAFLTTDLVPGTANDLVWCPNTNQPIDNVDVRTGGFASAVENGLTRSALGTEGRLLCKDQTGAEPLWLDPPLDSIGCEPINNLHADDLDDTPPWTFLNSVTEVSPAGACSGVSSTSAMTSCLDAWKAWPGTHTEDLFSLDIATSPRFGWVPLLNTDPQTGGSGTYDIIDFQPVYLHTVYLKCSGPSSCDVAFIPGEPNVPTCTDLVTSCGWPSNGKKAIDAVTSFMVPRSALPSPLSDFPFDTSQASYNLSE